jgi:phosphoribosylformylglycinamidine (FGAM) synthase-like enzyme
MLFKNNLGLSINLPKSLLKCDSKDPTLHSWCFGEDQGRIIVATNKIDDVESFLEDGNIDYFILGKTNSSNNLNLNDMTIISINDIKELNDQTLPSLMGE